jgi:hypothetical protein
MYLYITPIHGIQFWSHWHFSYWQCSAGFSIVPWEVSTGPNGCSFWADLPFVLLLTFNFASHFYSFDCMCWVWLCSYLFCLELLFFLN